MATIRLPRRRMLAGLAFLSAGDVACAQAPHASPQDGPFADVPLSSPVYAVFNYLERLGWFTGFLREHRGALTRYECAVMLVRILADMQRVESYFSPDAAPLGRPAPQPLLTNLGREGVIRSCALWTRALLDEFVQELAMLGSDPERARAELARFGARAGVIARECRRRWPE